MGRKEGIKITAEISRSSNTSSTGILSLKQGTSCKATTLQSYLADPQRTGVFDLNNDC